MIWNLNYLRRLGSGAVLAFVCGASAACGGGDDIPGPTPPEQPPADEGVAPTAGCTDGVLEHGALFQVCFPGTWNGDLVLYAHGYVAAHHPISLPDDVIGGQSISAAVTGLGYAFATTSYRANGLVAPEAAEDLAELEARVRRLYRPDPTRSVIVGMSEGGLVATLAVEHHPEIFEGALAGCGPIGDFQAQLNYIGDFRVVFDYLFPGIIPGNAVDVPDDVRSRWDQLYVPAIVVALAANYDGALQLIGITGAPVAGNDLQSIAETTVSILWYDVFGMNDARARLGGQPFDNAARIYAGSDDDTALNTGVDRFSADPVALSNLSRFETTGNLAVPLTLMHTTGDPIVPFSQFETYAEKVSQAGKSAFLDQLPSDRHGHCTFQALEILSAFSALMQKVGGQPASLLALTRH